MIFENNFYVKSGDSEIINNNEIINNINEIKSEKKEENLTEKPKIVIEKEPSISQAELEKIILNREKQVSENNKSLQPAVTEEEIPEIIGVVSAKIISDQKIDNKNFTLEFYEKQTWNSASMGCPINGMNYAQVETNGYKISFLKNQDKEEYHTDLVGNYINCSEILKSNSNANFNFVKQLDLENVQKIELRLNQDDKIISSIEDTEKINSIVESINMNIHITKSEICEANYKLIFEKKSSSTELLVYCKINPYYVYTDESINAGETILSIVAEMLSSKEFPGMPK